MTGFEVIEIDDPIYKFGARFVAADGRTIWCGRSVRTREEAERQIRQLPAAVRDQQPEQEPTS